LDDIVRPCRILVVDGARLLPGKERAAMKSLAALFLVLNGFLILIGEFCSSERFSLGTHVLGLAFFAVGFGAYFRKWPAWYIRIAVLFLMAPVTLVFYWLAPTIGHTWVLYLLLLYVLLFIVLFIVRNMLQNDP
jgi:hypothetical protein